MNSALAFALPFLLLLPRIATVQKNGASLYMRALLDQKEKLDIRSQYVHTHSNVYLHVILGKVVAGGRHPRHL